MVTICVLPGTKAIGVTGAQRISVDRSAQYGAIPLTITVGGPVTKSLAAAAARTATAALWVETLGAVCTVGAEKRVSHSGVVLSYAT
jgi:hypothetical protein